MKPNTNLHMQLEIKHDLLQNLKHTLNSTEKKNCIWMTWVWRSAFGSDKLLHWSGFFNSGPDFRLKTLDSRLKTLTLLQFRPNAFKGQVLGSGLVKRWDLRSRVFGGCYTIRNSFCKSLSILSNLEETDYLAKQNFRLPTFPPKKTPTFFKVRV